MLITKYLNLAVVTNEGPRIHNLVFTHRAFRDIRRLPQDIRERIEVGLDRLREDPYTLASRLVDETLGQYRYRVGDYRIIFDIHGNNIVVLRVGHRREIYRK